MQVFQGKNVMCIGTQMSVVLLAIVRTVLALILVPELSAHSFAHALAHAAHKKVPRTRLRAAHIFWSCRIVSHNLA